MKFPRKPMLTDNAPNEEQGSDGLHCYKNNVHLQLN